MKNKHPIPTPPFWLSIIPVAFTAVILSFSVFMLDAEPHFSLFLGAVVAGFCAFFHGYSWEQIKDGFKKSITRTIPSLIILLIIGMLISVWIASGIVPAMMYYGLQIMSARWFLPIILVLCSIMALITGSSWSTVGTIGVAAIGIGSGLGISPAMTAGAVVSGSFFGDKISPMSDSTNLTPSVLGVNLFEHIKHMLHTTLPAYAITLILFTILGLVNADSSAAADASRYTDHIKEYFNFSPLLFIPPAAVIILIIKKVPAIPSLLGGLILGIIACLVVQNGTLTEIATMIHDGFVLDTGNDEIDMLFSRGGMTSMYNVIILALISLSLGGILHHTGMLHAIVIKLYWLTRSAGSLTATVIGTSIFVNIFSANQYLAVILPGQMYEECYRNKDLKLKNLTRTLEAGGTMTAPLIPWNSSGVFASTSIGVSVSAFAPFALLCWITPLIAILFGFLT